MITSGVHGATVGGPIAMAYVKTALRAENTRLDAPVPGRALPVRVAKLPLMRPSYHRG